MTIILVVLKMKIAILQDILLQSLYFQLILIVKRLFYLAYRKTCTCDFFFPSTKQTIVAQNCFPVPQIILWHFVSKNFRPEAMQDDILLLIQNCLFYIHESNKTDFFSWTLQKIASHHCYNKKGVPYFVNILASKMKNNPI